MTEQHKAYLPLHFICELEASEETFSRYTKKTDNAESSVFPKGTEFDIHNNYDDSE